MSIFSFFRAKNSAKQTALLYGAIVRQARQPVFYEDAYVPDTMDGRFDMILLHLFLVLWALKSKGKKPTDGGQALFRHLVGDMDRSLREMGVGDLSVGKRIKVMVEAFYGRVAVYETGLMDPDPTALHKALQRNLYGTVAHPDAGVLSAMAGYVRRQGAHLAQQFADDILVGRVNFLSFTGRSF